MRTRPLAYAVAFMVVLFDRSVVLGFTQNQSPAHELGQTSLVATVTPGPTQVLMTTPNSVVYDPIEKWLFVADQGNNRVMFYDLSSNSGVLTADGVKATGWVGTGVFPNWWTQTQPAAGARGLTNPSGLAFDPTRKWLFISDSGNNRILVYDYSNCGTGSSPGFSSTDVASYVIGQPDFNSTQPNQGLGSPNSGTLSNPTGLTYDMVHQKLYVADQGNNRVLEFDIGDVPPPPTGRGATPTCPALTASPSVSANFVFGQPDFNSNSHGLSQTGMHEPDSVAIDPSNMRLFVGDSMNARVLVFNVMNLSSNGIPAAYVLGQTNFTSGTGGTTNSTLAAGNRGVSYDPVNQRLFVGDKGNNRVLEFDLAGVTLTNGLAATSVLGQNNFTTQAAAPLPNGLSNPMDVAYDSTQHRLFVIDSLNDRLLVYNDMLPTPATFTNLENACNVLGQQDFVSNSPATTQSGLQYPQANPAYDARYSRLFVPDQKNNRVLVYDLSSGISNGMNAAHVLGQSNFTSNATALTQAGMNWPNAVAYDAVRQWLFVADMINSRVLVFDLSAGISDGMNASFVLGQSNFTTNVQGTSATMMNQVDGVAYDPSTRRLYVADYFNSRVLVFDLSNGISSGMAARFAIGVPDFVSQGGYCSQNSLSNPTAMTIDPDRQWLIVADDVGLRIVVFDLSGGIVNGGINASYVLGEQDFSTCTNFQFVPNQNDFNEVFGLTYDPTNRLLFVADGTSLDRVLIFDLSGGITNPSPNPMNAVSVLGQSWFGDGNQNDGGWLKNGTQGPYTVGMTMNGPDQYGFDFPQGVAFDSVNQRLFVADTHNSRMLIFGPGAACGVGGGSSSSSSSSSGGSSTSSSSSSGSSSSGGSSTSSSGSSSSSSSGSSSSSSSGGSSTSSSSSSGSSSSGSSSSSSSGGGPTSCGGTDLICGSITAAEGANPSLSGVPIELRDWRGERLATHLTDDTGSFSFGTGDGLLANNTYYVTPVVGRSQSSVPLDNPVLNLPPTGVSPFSFQLRGWPATFVVSAPSPASLVLLSSWYYSQPTPPPMGIGANATIGGLYSTTTGSDSTARLQVPPGAYYLRCWLQQQNGMTFNYSSTTIHGPYSIDANQVSQLACPQ